MSNYDTIVEIYKLRQEPEDDLKIFYANDYPIPYKDIILYPVQVDLYYYFHLLAQCLVMPHKTSGDIKAISLSYLKYLFYLITDKKQFDIAWQLTELLLVVLKKNKIYIDKDGKEQSTISLELDKGIIKIEDKNFDSNDFDKIKRIILEQNAIEIPDETINPEILKAYREIEEIKFKQCQMKMCNFEDQINIVVAKSSYTRQEITQMTIRSFSRLFDRITKIINYEVQSAQAPYMDKEGQKQIKHYLIDDEKTLKERCEEAFADLNQLKEKIQQ